MQRTRDLTRRALAEPLALRSVPPFGRDATSYGDLVPLGLLLLALCRGGLHDDAMRVREHLLSRRVRGLWPYHTGTLETSIDSALVLLGVMDSDAIAELERFNIGGGRYIPQLFTDGREPGKMTVRDSLRHWCAADYSIACLVRALRRRAGLDERTPASLLEEGFDTRSGLYLANPYFVDWMLAMALDDDSPLRERLAAEVLASASPAGTFGSYDVLLSTALAVLTLRELGVDVTRHVDALAQLYAEPRTPSTPFYSSEETQWSAIDKWELLLLMTSEGRDQLIRVKEREHAVTWYRDVEGIVVEPLVALALLHSAETATLHARPATTAHARYTAPTASAYIATHALVPYS